MSATSTSTTAVQTPLRVRIAATVVAAATIAAGTFAVTFGAGDRIDVTDSPQSPSAVSRYDDVEANKAQTIRALGLRSPHAATVSRAHDLERNKRHTMRALGIRADAE